MPANSDPAIVNIVHWAITSNIISVFISVFGSWGLTQYSTTKREREQRRISRLERQLHEFYGQITVRHAEIVVLHRALEHLDEKRLTTTGRSGLIKSDDDPDVKARKAWLECRDKLKERLKALSTLATEKAALIERPTFDAFAEVALIAACANAVPPPEERGVDRAFGASQSADLEEAMDVFHTAAIADKANIEAKLKELMEPLSLKDKIWKKLGWAPAKPELPQPKKPSEIPAGVDDAAEDDDQDESEYESDMMPPSVVAPS